MDKNIEKKELISKIMFILGIVLCVILLPLLIINITMIIKSYTNKDEVPSIGNIVPFIVNTNSMEDVISGGDLIICEKLDDTSDLPLETIISFYDPSGNGVSVVTHRIINKELRDSQWYYQTKGDNNNVEDSEWVCQDKIIAKYKFSIPVIGSISLFMSTTPGLIVCVLCPLLLLVGYDVMKRKLNDKANEKDTEALLAELEQLRAEKNKQSDQQE